MVAAVTCALCDSLGSNDGNLFSNTDEAKNDHARLHFKQSKVFDDNITENEILQRCFPKRQPKTELSQMECKQSLLDLCQSLLKHRSKSAPFVCNMCGVGISIKESKRILNHACTHLEFKIFKCRHCDQSLSTGDTIRQHVQRVHNIRPTNDDFEDRTVEHFDEILLQIKQCFSNDYPRVSGLQRQFAIKSDCRDKRQRAINHFCRLIFTQRSKPTNLECNLCGLRVGFHEQFHARQMYHHAAAHLEDKLFTCRHCTQSVSSRRAMREHLWKSHQIIDGSAADFNDQSEKFHSEHLNMIERCFSGGRHKLEVTSAKDQGSIRPEGALRSLITEPKLSVERHLLCNRLIRKSVDSEGKIKCSLCSKRSIVKFSGRALFFCVAFWHVETHVHKPLYRCKVCKTAFKTQPTVKRHLKKAHALGLKKNYECMADKFHDDIMAMMSNCYAPVCIYNRAHRLALFALLWLGVEAGVATFIGRMFETSFFSTV